MSAIITHEVKVDLEVRRCTECGTHWAVETTRTWRSPVCPCCAAGRIGAAEDRVSTAIRREQSLHGVITRQRNQIKLLKA